MTKTQISAQSSMWQFLNVKAPDDQILFISQTPGEVDWSSEDHDFQRKWPCFNLRDPLLMGFRPHTRFFRVPDPWVGKPVMEDPDPITTLAVPLLKSHIQKCVRRCLPQKAASAAFQLLEHDPLELLRRIPIIMVEDKRVHEDLPMIIWGMLQLCENPAWKMPVEFAHRVISVVYDMAKSFEHADPKRGLKGLPEGFKQSMFTDQSPTNRAIAYCLMIRAEHGGTDGDVALLRNEAAWWIVEPLEPIRSSYGSLDIDAVICDRTIIPQAVDFHIMPGLISYLFMCHGEQIKEFAERVFPETDKIMYDSLVRKAIWFYWSAQRYCPDCCIVRTSCDHRPVDEMVAKLEMLWNIFADTVDSYARTQLRKTRDGTGPFPLTEPEKKRWLEEKYENVKEICDDEEEEEASMETTS